MAASRTFGSTEFSYESLEFTGTGREYFRIWVINLALTVATLGIYSAWAKVRRLQYFYRHTRLLGASFDFHGEPHAILRGRFIAVGLFILYSTAGWVGPGFLIFVLAALAICIPWLLYRAFRFRFGKTSYRGIRFRFLGSLPSSYWVFLGLPALSVLSLFILTPFWHQRMRRYQHANAAYGDTQFAFSAPVGEFYVVYAALAGVLIGVMFAAGGALLVAAFGAAIVASLTGGGVTDRADLLVFLPVFVVYATGLVFLRAFAIARIQNLVWSHTRLGRVGFRNILEIRPLFRILWVNLFATLVTLGLYRPFAQIRLAEYMIRSIRVSSPELVVEFASVAPEESLTAVGDEATEFFDVDIAL